MIDSNPQGASDVAILSTGMYVPSKEISNELLRERYGASGRETWVDKYQAQTGITRRWHEPREDWATSDLAVVAARQALERANLDPLDIDLIILGTEFPDYVVPGTSLVVQHKLGASNAGTYDINCACASFPTALANAAGMIKVMAGMDKVLIIGVSMASKLLDHEGPMALLVGDGAAAAVVGRSENPGFGGTVLFADGSFHQSFGIFSGGTFEPASEQAVAAGRTQLQMTMRIPSYINNEGWPRQIRRFQAQYGVSLNEIDHFIFTQFSLPSIETVMADLDQPMEKAVLTLDRYGYMGSASLPATLHVGVMEGRIRPGDQVLFVATGGGYNQAVTLMRITEDLVCG